jgi:hypothetical protein
MVAGIPPCRRKLGDYPCIIPEQALLRNRTLAANQPIQFIEYQIIINLAYKLAYLS